MITLVITSPAETITREGVASVSLPAFSGRMQVLPGHAESFVSLKEGDVVARFSGNAEDAVTRIFGGECHIKDDRVVIIL